MNSYEITVLGKVQGIGFIPFVAEYAEEHNLKGAVRNSGASVKIHVVCESDEIGGLTYYLRYNCPAGGRVDNIVVKPMKKHLSAESFQIIESDDYDDGMRFLPADIGICPECVKELRNPESRRYKYPFISCKSCGPRYSVMYKAPYARKNSAMREFELCDECKNDYKKMGDRRRNDQVIGCKDCGPQLKLYVNRLSAMYGLSQDAILDKTIELLKNGKVGAVKDQGTFRFVFRPDNDNVIRKMRIFKNRDTMPFGIMFPDIDMMKEYLEVSEEEEKLLTSDARPMVILKRKTESFDKKFSGELCKDNGFIGVMLPATGLHVILTDALGPLAFASGKRRGEPVITEDETMMKYLSADGLNDFMESIIPGGINNSVRFLGGSDEYSETSPNVIIDFMLTSNLSIITPMEDSVIHMTPKLIRGVKRGEISQFIRRSRGYIPDPVMLEEELPQDSFAAGGDLKSVFALSRKNAVYMSEHLGMMTNESSGEIRANAVEHFKTLLNIQPEALSADLQPDFISTEDALKRNENTSFVQHHKAHVLSVVAEHSIKGKFLGMAFDYQGYGDDETIWGSEIFSCNIPKQKNVPQDEDGRNQFYMRRVASLSPVKLLGDKDSSKDALSTLCCYLKSVEDRQLISISNMDKTMTRVKISRSDYGVICACLRADINTYRASSMGLLFDAVCALLGIKTRNTYEGECAVLLEQYAYRFKEKLDRNEVKLEYDEDSPVKSLKPIKVRVTAPKTEKEIYRFDQTLLIADILDKYLMLTNEPEFSIELIREQLAYEFYMAITSALTEMADIICGEDYINQIVIGGGMLYNRLFAGSILGNLEELGYKVCTNTKVPCGDGGLALGQIFALGLQSDMG